MKGSTRISFWIPAFAIGLYGFFGPLEGEPILARFGYSVFFGWAGQFVGSAAYILISMLVGNFLGHEEGAFADKAMAPDRLVPALLLALARYAWQQAERNEDFEELTDCVTQGDEAYLLADDVIEGARRLRPRDITLEFAVILSLCRETWGSDVRPVQ